MTTERLRVRDTDVKALYASAYLCAYPDCAEVLYKVSGDGEMIRNSVIAHIHAATRNGPRALEPFDAEAVRRFDNLLLLCAQHGSQIDQQPDSYPVEMLRDWKVKQMNVATELHQGWTISDSEAAEVADTDPSIRALTVGSGSGFAVAVHQLLQDLRRGCERSNDILAEWEGLKAKLSKSVVAWGSETGEPYYAQPSEADRQRYAQRLGVEQSNSLAEFDRNLGAASAAAAGLQAIIGPPAKPYIDDFVESGERLREELAQSSSQLNSFVQILGEDAERLTALARGESPTRREALPAKPEVVKTDDEIALTNLSDAAQSVLEQSAPFGRVSGLPFGEDLANRILELLPDLVPFPDTAQADVCGLSLLGMSGALAAVARNASPEQFAKLLEDTDRLPLACIATTLIAHRTVQDQDQNLPAVESRLADLATRLPALLCDAATWTDNRYHMTQILPVVAEFAGDPTALIREAITATPGLAPLIVGSLALPTDSHDPQSGGYRHTYTEIRARYFSQWAPIAELTAALLLHDEHLTPVAPRSSAGTNLDEFTRLASEFLYVFGTGERQQESLG